MWQRQAEEFVAISVTPDEVMALNDAIVCYLGYLYRIPAMIQEYAEIILLLQRFQWRLTACIQRAQSSNTAGSQDGEVQP